MKHLLSLSLVLIVLGYFVKVCLFFLVGISDKLRSAFPVLVGHIGAEHPVPQSEGGGIVSGEGHVVEIMKLSTFRR